MNRRVFIWASVLAPAFFHPVSAWAANLPPTMNGLVLANSQRLQAVYLLPGADFRAYAQVMLDPAEVDFKKDWRNDYNLNAQFGQQLSESDAEAIMTAVRTGFDSIFRKAFADAGYAIATAPAKNVLRLSTAVENLTVTAPDQSMVIGSTYGGSAGQATLVLEARDSLTGALLGLAEDAEIASSSGWQLLDSVTNREDFSRLFKTWADASVKGMAVLKANSPYRPSAKP